jgi:hypothetical protein
VSVVKIIPVTVSQSLFSIVPSPGKTGLTGPSGAVGPTGPTGPRGPGDSGASDSFEYLQLAPQATWIVPVPLEFSRTPSVDVFFLNGEKVLTDIVVTSTFVTITFASPVAGSAVLT